MGSHPYEYKVLVEYISPEERGRFPHFTHIEDQESLTGIIEAVFSHLPESIPEGWEVNSHNITVSRDTLPASLLGLGPLGEQARRVDSQNECCTNNTSKEVLKSNE